MDQAIALKVVNELRALEEGLWRFETRFDSSYMERVLAVDFTEIGRSGRVYDRKSILAVPPSQINAVLPLPNFHARELSDTVVLITYDSHLAEGGTISCAHRSSVWVQDNEGWQLHFHQGTPFELAT